MSWKTIYVTGREGFLDDVLKNLGRSGVEVMSGFNSRQNADSYELFWVPEAMAMRDFKLAVGAKTVLRYRLKFCTSLEGFIEKHNSEEFTAEERRQVEKMRRAS